jgi:CDP-glycerol glycerophosphotransferase
MIPKIVHYSWFSNEPMPEIYLQIMEGWKKVLPDYEFKLWDAKALEEANILFANEAISVKKWAFAADAIRVYAVYHYGGIWLDGDAAVYQSFNPFLNHRMFIGKEHLIEFQHDGSNHNMSSLTSHCFGAEKGHPFMKDCVDYYQNRHFILSNKENLPEGLRYDMRLMPSIQALLAVKYGYQGRVPNLEEIERLDEGIRVYPPYYFDAPRYHSAKDSVCVHFKMGSWRVANTWNPTVAMHTAVRKKGCFYYLYTWINKYLVKKGYYLKVISV